MSMKWRRQNNFIFNNMIFQGEHPGPHEQTVH